MPGSSTTTVGFIVEGLTIPGYAGIVWCAHDPPPNSDGYLWWDSLTVLPNAIDDSCDPWTGAYRAGPMDFSVVADDLAMSLFFVPAREAFGVVTGDYTPGDGAIQVAGESIFPAGTLIWVGDECLELGGHIGADVYPVTGGRAETTEGVHRAGDLIFPRQKYMRRRRFRMVVYDWDTDDLRTRARGYVTNAVTSDDGTSIAVSTDGAMSMLARATLNRESRRIRVQGPTRNGVLRNAYSDHITRASRDPASSSNLQTGDSIASGLPLSGTTWYAVVSGPQILGAPRFPRGAFSDPESREIFVIDANRQSGSNSKRLENDGPGYWRHRLALALGFLRAGAGTTDGPYDRWTGHWGLGLDLNFFDLDQIEAQIASRSPDVDQLVLGWDGEQESLTDIVCEYLLRPDGSHLASTEDNRIRFARYEMPTVLDAANAPLIVAVPPNLRKDARYDSQFSALLANVGELPWQDPEPIAIDVISGEQLDTTRNTFYEGRSELRYDFRTWSRQRDELVPRANAALERIRRPTPSLRIKTNPIPGETFDLGRWYRFFVEVEPAFFVNADGERVETLTTSEALGYLVGRRYDVKTGSFILTLLTHVLDGRLARLRAPSAEITAASSGTVITVDSSGLIVAGDVIQTCDADLEPDAVRTVVSVTDTTITVDSPVLVAVGQIVRIADFATYGTGGDPYGVGRAWTFIADNTDNLIDNTDPADTFG